GKETRGVSATLDEAMGSLLREVERAGTTRGPRRSGRRGRGNPDQRCARPSRRASAFTGISRREMVEDKGAHATESQCIAVRFGTSSAADTNTPVRPADIFNDDWSSKRISHFLSKDSPLRVERAARS